MRISSFTIILITGSFNKGIYCQYEIYIFSLKNVSTEFVENGDIVLFVGTFHLGKIRAGDSLFLGKSSVEMFHFQWEIRNGNILRERFSVLRRFRSENVLFLVN